MPQVAGPASYHPGIVPQRRVNLTVPILGLLSQNLQGWRRASDAAVGYHFGESR